MACSWTPVTLGSHGPPVLPIGIAASYGVGGADLERAFERGVNFFYWGSMRRGDFGRGIARIAKKARERMVVVVQSYARMGSAIGPSLDKALCELSLDHADVLLLGWWNHPPADRILDAARALVDKGRAKQVMISCHHRPTFPLLAKDPRIDLLMVRYNAAHPGAEQEVFPHLPEPRPGIVAYTATSWGQLVDPQYVPAGEKVPTAADCYRFALSSSFVDATWTGARHGRDVDEALRALDLGPMSAEELEWMKRVGAVIREKANVRRRGVGIADKLIDFVSGFGTKAST